MLATPTSRPQTLQPAYMTHRTNRSRSPRRRFFHSASKKASGPREAAIDPRAARLSSASASWQKHWRQRRRAAATGAERERLPTAKRPAGRTLAVVLSGHRGDRLRTARSRLGRAPRPGTSEPARQWLSPRCECSCCSRSWRPFGDVSGATSSGSRSGSSSATSARLSWAASRSCSSSPPSSSPRTSSW